MNEVDYPLWRLTKEQERRAKYLYDQWLSDRDNVERLRQLRDERDDREAYQRLAWT